MGTTPTRAATAVADDGAESSVTSGQAFRGAPESASSRSGDHVRVRPVPGLPQRTPALRTAHPCHRSWLPAYVCRPHRGPEDAAV